MRRDKRGRRIGRHWWRDMNNSLLLDAQIVWMNQCEAATSMYDTEVAEYAAENPRPTLKAFLLANKGMHRDPLA